MEAKQIRELLKQKFGDAVTEVVHDGDGWVKVKRDGLLEIAQFIKEDSELVFDLLHCITAVDLEKGNLQCIYNLTSTSKKHWICLKVDVPASEPSLPTLSTLWKTADWHEREAYDMMGLLFTGHPNLKRILCDEDWVGHPLRKDYVYPKEFRGVLCDVIQEEDEAIPLPRTLKK
ncbi:MAG: NADH-quinone oxidoreductase subunit C [Planctomycetota bacterium]